ncbi:MAG: SEC-C metal-binding domain-containing protein [Verrucomicrobia bacterium]|nr:SEC-C metal-binding domain-containing protein [Verrucomicrobiota bacterium]
MQHYTLNTNHTCVQEDYKRGIGPSMAPLLGGGNLGLVAKQFSAFRVTVTRRKGGGLFTVWRGQEPLVTCGVALAAEAATEVWPEVEKLYLDLSDKDPHKLDARHEAKEPASTPWLAVVILPSLAMLTQSDRSWLGDFERCMAWTIAWDEAGRPDEPGDEAGQQDEPQEEAEATGKQPGRNDPCPCGSGKKIPRGARILQQRAGHSSDQLLDQRIG